jgi:hypothetical protein
VQLNLRPTDDAASIAILFCITAAEDANVVVRSYDDFHVDDLERIPPGIEVPPPPTEELPYPAPPQRPAKQGAYTRSEALEEHDDEELFVFGRGGMVRHRRHHLQTSPNRRPATRAVLSALWPAVCTLNCFFDRDADAFSCFGNAGVSSCITSSSSSVTPSSLSPPPSLLSPPRLAVPLNEHAPHALE